MAQEGERVHMAATSRANGCDGFANQDRLSTEIELPRRSVEPLAIIVVLLFDLGSGSLLCKMFAGFKSHSHFESQLNVD
jgi:hypothetical protein